MRYSIPAKTAGIFLYLIKTEDVIYLFRSIKGYKMNRRNLSEGELRILRLIQDHYGSLNTEDEVIFVDDGAVLWVKDETGGTVLMVHLTNLSAWRENGIIPSEDILLSDWLGVSD